MRITIEIDSKNEMDKLSALFKSININTVKIVSNEITDITVTKGDKKIDPRGLFGIWASKPRSLENIRKDAWERNS